ncbi:hypothetical protein BC941DRAFT_59459 [Chlamydoabsidia padenii]|nr:hypothetical protein BC941DRAFT_59459 [Chlamydoabsidia padenii]
MTCDDQTSLQQEWWDSLQQFDVEKVKQLYTAHPHLLWVKMVDPVSRPIVSDSLQPAFDHDLGSSLDNLNSLQWLLFYYNDKDDAKTLISHILDKTTSKEFNDDNRLGWGDRNNTTLHLISALGYEDLATLLLQKGVSADVANAKGRLPIHVAQTDIMVTRLDTGIYNKTLTKKVNDVQPDNNEANRFQQSATSSSSSSSTGETSSSASTPTTLITPNKDQHYFRPGQVERTKQKVLMDEQVELEKQRERRRKDIAILAKRSAVKNNPFVKKEEPAQESFSGLDLPHSSTSLATLTGDSTTNDAALNPSLRNAKALERKHKRNSKVINSLQTKSYVSSSIFRQGQPSLPARSQRSNLASPSLSQQDNSDQSTLAVATTTTNDNTHLDDSNGQTMDIPTSRSTPNSPTSLPSPSKSNTPDISKTETSINVDRDLFADYKDGDTSDDNDNDDNDNDNSGQSTPSLSKMEQQEEERPQSPIMLNMDHHHHQPQSTPTVGSTPISSSPSTSISSAKCYTLSDGVNSTTRPELSTKTEIPDSEMQDDVLKETFSNMNTKRQSGSQKTNWTKELTSWESVLNREFSLGNKAHPKEDTPSPSSSTSLDSDPDSTVASLLVASNSAPDEKHHQQHSKPYGLDDDESRRQGADNNTIFEGSRLPLKSYGSVSVRSMATYARRLPTPAFDSPTLSTGNQIDPPITLSQTAISGSTLHTPQLSTQPNYNDRKITRSISVSDLSPNPPNKSNNHHEHKQKQNHHLQQQRQQQQEPSTFIQTPINIKNCGRGKLYIRVHGVHDILLPLPKDRAHVRCVIGDGRYEYMSRYETLAQDITFGYECIIDSHPNMIVTLSLHVRPDYMLKKPLTRLFSSNRKRKGSLSAYVSNEDGAIGQTRFAVGDMLGVCYRRSYSASFHCFNAWYVHSRDKLPSSSSLSRQHDSDQGVLKVVGNFKVEMLYLPVSDPSLPVPKNLREIDMAIKIQQWNETRFDNDLPKIQRPPPRVA